MSKPWRRFPPRELARWWVMCEGPRGTGVHFIRRMTKRGIEIWSNHCLLTAKYPHTLCQKIDNYFHKDDGMKFVLEALEAKPGETCQFKITVVDKAPPGWTGIPDSRVQIGVYNTREQLLDALEPYLQMEETR